MKVCRNSRDRNKKRVREGNKEKFYLLTCVLTMSNCFTCKLYSNSVRYMLVLFLPLIYK